MNGGKAPGDLSLQEVQVTKARQGALAGDAQTINRGELMALIKFVEYAKGKGAMDVGFYTDSGYVDKGCSKLYSKTKAKSNRDLWRRLREAANGMQLTVKKT
eukprot:2973037-Lingulodinium_polyedra.AAC.1